MEKFFLLGLAICAGWTLLLPFIPSVEAALKETVRHIPIEQVLEFTLKGLQESLHNTLQQNEQLAFENAIVWRNIQELRRKQEFLDSKESGAVNGSYPEHVLRGKEPAKITPNAKIQRTVELIALFEQEIKRLNEEIRTLDHKLDDRTFESRRKVLDQRKNMGVKNLTWAEKRYKVLVEGNKASLEIIEQLKAENEGLAQDLKKIMVGY
jgi:hypothetical protein